MLSLGLSTTSLANHSIPSNSTKFSKNVTIEELNRVIKKSSQNSWDELQNNTWNFPTYLGTWFLSEYYFELKALGLLEQSKFNETYFT